MPRPLCTDENQRLAKLLSYSILDTESELAYDDITCLVKQICNVPIALISLVDRDRQWFKSIQGLEASQTSREVSFCTRTIQQTEVMVVPDAAQDPRFADNPLVTGEPYIRFYAGAPLVTSDGFALGSLCAIDTQPRTFSEEQRQSLVALSRLTLNQLELRRTLQLRQQAEEKLIVQQTEFEQLISKAPGMLFQSRRDPDGHLSFPYVSDRASELFGGLTPAEIRADAKAVGNLVKPEFKAEWRQMIATSVETLKNLDCTVPMVDRRGHEKWIKVHTTAEQSPDGSVLWHGVMTDVTERRNIEAKAAATQQLLQLILDTVPQGILWKDRNLVFQGCNRQLADMLGLDSPEQIIGKTDFEIQDSPEQAEWYRSCDRRVIESGQPQLGMIETLTVNGNTIWLNTSRLPIQNDAGEVERILITIEDITPLKQAQQQAADQAAELQQTLQTLRQTHTKIVQAEKMSGLAQLVAGVAHEINNPVGFISGNIAHAQSYIADLLSLIDTYQLHHSSLLSAALAAVEAERAELDIDFVRKDLPHLLTSMKAGTRRIITIVESLCTFS
ncbi:MAG: PAS domain S-box protein, partial [Cyanobacteria bacterium P01_D01_bin.128]